MSNYKKLYGVTTAMITAFDENEKANIENMRKLTRFLIDKGVHCLYPLGTTGEVFKISADERKSVAEAVIKEADKKVPVYIHVGAMRTDETIELAQHAYHAGADGIGIVTPIYFGVNDREMESYFVQVAKSVPEDFPVYLYNIPQLSANDLRTDTINRIVDNCKNVVGIKYSYADFFRTYDYLKIKNRFSVLHGADSLFIAALAMGCDGTVSGISCVYPEPYVEIYKAYNEGNLMKARQFQDIANKYCKALKAGTNMAYFKEALSYRGIDAGYMRKPQLSLTDTEREDLIKTLQELDKEYKELCEQ